ncbi:phage replication protein O, N-terminal domain [uncultured Avibacterium sp.]|uniref:Phage replication protein O, N-terminal domain n=1 Tax=uncultured Avibacterium sp. TaxID=1936169 RepID=A0A486X9Y0_9PAST|nr:phage replication protein O, N-terminal domain [uncultured Avibacterium sp.]
MSNQFIPNSFQLPNSVVDDLIRDLTGAELKCYLVIVRKTKGWNKDCDAISISQLMEVTGLSNRAVIDACNHLTEIGLLTRQKGARGVNVFTPNLCKKFTSEESSPVKKVHSTCEESSQDPVKKVHTQNNNKNTTKNTNTSSEKISDGGVGKKSRFKFSDDDMTAAQWIFGLVQKLSPNVKPPSFENWANEIRLMRERDGRTHREICELFQWANQDSFWKVNILSPAKLREKWDQLTVKKNNTKPPRKTVSELNAIEWNTEEGWRGML